MKDTRATMRFFLSCLFFGLFLWSQSGCEPDDYSLDVNLPAGSAAVSAKSAEDVSVSLQALSAVEFLCEGEFSAAQEILQSAAAHSNGAVAVLKDILENRRILEDRREAVRAKVWEKQQEKLDAQRRKIPDFALADVNDIDLTLALAIRLHELAKEDEKQAILDDPFVRGAAETAIQRSRDYEQNGRWTDAYVHAYYWLTALYEDNREYRAQADKLTELFSIELSLKDGTCEDKVDQRYAGVKPEMFLRALHLLESSYVIPLGYPEMIDTALVRCGYLAEVLSRSGQDLVVRSDPQKIEAWRAGLEAIRNEMRIKEAKDLSDVVQLFEEILALNGTTLGIPEEVMIAQFSESVLSALDPFTELVWPWYVQDFEKNLTQQFSGIGVEISKAAGPLTVVSLLPDTPAYHAGLDADDEILAVNGESTEEMTIFCAVKKITGRQGTKVNLTVRRPSTGQTREYTIKRDRIVVQPIRGWQRKENGQWDFWVDSANRIGYVRLTAFTETSQGDLDAILKDLEKEGMEALILDLRYNSGGYLNSAAEVADLFVSEGVIVKSNPRHGFPAYDIAHKKGTHPDYPMAILINGGSASASEIVAGALQDPRFSRAVLVGTRSYGKGSVQVVTPYSGDGSQLKYTMAYYHLPGDQQVKNRYQAEKEGRTDWGIAPDVEVKMYSHELRQMLEIQRENDILVQKGEHHSNHVRRYDLKQTLLSDPQLSTALFLMQARKIGARQEVQPQETAFWTMPIDPNEVE